MIRAITIRLQWPTLVLLTVFLFIARASAGDRVALVVGNGAYANATALNNPPNDAADIASVLRELDFEVILAADADKASFDQRLRDFARLLRGARTAVFYYAGHGMQVAGKNYAIPVDARLETAADLGVETIDIDQVLMIMQSDENRVNIVFLDACRDNPLTRSFARALPATRAVSVGTGLTAVDAGRGMLIVFATAPNKLALDGRARNSPFTAALLKHIRTPGLDIAFVMRRVTADVEAASGGAQVPWMHASLTTDVVLARAQPTGIGSAPPASVSAPYHPPSVPAPQVKVPDLPMPASVPISSEMLQTVGGHPFFGNVPPVRVRSYALSSAQDLKQSIAPVTTSADSEVMVKWLRPGIVALEKVSREVTTQAGKSTPSNRKETVVLAANGFVELGETNTAIWRGGRGVSSTKLLRLDNIKGNIFPVAVGNQFSHAATYQHPHMKDEYHYKETCDIVRKYDARSFHPKLSGSAYVASCQYEGSYRRNKTIKSSGMSRKTYIEVLGLWIDADPISRNEQIVSNVFTNLTASETRYTLKAFDLEP